MHVTGVEETSIIEEVRRTPLSTLLPEHFIRVEEERDFERNNYFEGQEKTEENGKCFKGIYYRIRDNRFNGVSCQF